MSCSVPVFACIQDVERVISILNDAPTTGEEDVKESTGESDKLFTNDTLYFKIGYIIKVILLSPLCPYETNVSLCQRFSPAGVGNFLIRG